jgi:hypothetical protein
MSRTSVLIRLHYENAPIRCQNRRDLKGMKYILMMYATKADCDWYARWSKEDLQTNFAFMRAFSKELKDSCAYVAAVGLAFPDQAKIVRAGSDGTPITDGVFPEAKEFLMGYWIVDVEDAEEAYGIAARASAAPVPGGTLKDEWRRNHPDEPGTMPIEVRQVMSGPPEELQ